MHMSSACPWGRIPGQPGEYVGEYKGMDWLLCPSGQGKICDIVLISKERGGGIQNFVKSQAPTTEISGGFAAFPNP